MGDFISSILEQSRGAFYNNRIILERKVKMI